MANRIQLRRDGAQQWANVNPTLAQGELGIEIDTGRIKIGDGVTTWNQLRYERPIEAETNTANTLVKRDADGGFQAGAITATLIGNASTATRLANARQITLTGDLVGSSTFDGSSNLSLIAQLSFVTALPHYDPLNQNATGTYTKVTVDSQGRVKGASNPTSLAGYGITDAQPLDSDLTSLAGLTTPGIITRASEGNIVTRSIAVSDTGRLTISNGNAVSANPTLDLAETGVAAVSPAYFGGGATQKLFNVPGIASATQTVNATRIGVDIWGRIYSITDFPIATSVEGTTALVWATGTVYARYDKVTNAAGTRLYQALNAGTSGVTAPVHTSGDVTDGTVVWRHLGLVTTKQKGLASFDQEDFDVDANGHVMIALSGVDNTHLQNNQIRFADGNTFTSYELDNELTATTGYRGITTINNLSVNNTSGSPLLKCLAADDNVDINTTTSTIFSDITLDKTSTAIQTINRAGSLTLLMDANTASNRFLRLTATNVGAGEAKIEVTADEQISIISTNSDVRVEDIYFATNTISSTNSTIIIDPAGIGDNTGSVQIKGNLQVDGTTVTVNSTTMTVDDPIITLGGDTAPTVDDNKDRGVEIRYFDTQARLGFYGWDDSYTTLAGTTGGYRFLYNATNTAEVFSGTDAGVIAGNLALSSNTGSTSTTSGTLVVTGGTGISQNLWVGGTANVAGAVTFQSTLGVTDDVTLNKNVTIIGSDTAATEFFKIKNGSSVDKFTVDSSSGNTTIVGTLGVTGASTLTGNVTTQSASVVNIQNTTINNVAGAIAGTAYASLATYGVLKVDGGASFAKGVIVGGDLKIYGQFDVDGAVSYSGNTVFKGNISVDNDGITPFKFNVASSTGALDTIGIITTTNATDSSATNNGALVVTGGVGIGAQLRVGGAATITGNATFNANVTLIGSDTAAVDLFKIKNGSSVDKFTVDSATGNTTIVGTVGVQDVVTFSKNTDASALGTGALVVSAGGASINNQLRVGGATTIGGTLAVTGDSTLTGDLAVNGGDITTTSTTATLFNANATTLNIGQAATTVSIGATTGTLTIRNANTVITGNLQVDGTTTTVNSVTMTVDDKNLELGSVTTPTNVTADGGGLTLRGTSDKTIIWDNANTNWTSSEHWNTASGKDYKVNNTSVINSSRALVNITGLTMPGAFDITVNTNKFIVAGTTGNTTIAGTLGVTGATTLSSTLGVTSGATFSSTVGITGDLSVNSNKFVVTATNGNTAIAGTLGVTAATTLSSTLGVTGVASITNATSRTIPAGAAIPALGGAFQVTGGAHVGENFIVNGDLKVYGSAVYQGGIDYQGTQTYSGIIKQANVSDAASSTDLTASISTAGGVSITKKLFVGNNTSVGGTLGVTGNTTLSGTLGVTSTTTLTGALIANGNCTLGDTSVDTLTVNATSTFANPITFNNTLTSTSSVTMNGGSLSIKTSGGVDRFVFNPSTSAATITGTLGVTSNATVGGTFGVTSTTTLSAALDVTGITTLTGLLNANGGIAVDGTAFTVADTTGNTSIAGTLSVTDNVTLNKNVTIIGSNTAATELFKIQNASAADKFTVDSATGNTSIAGTLGVTSTSSFTGMITATGGITGEHTGNSSTATTLQTTRTFNVSGDATGTAQNFNGSANVVVPIILSTSGVTAGTYTKITVDTKGRATVGASATTTDIAEGTNLYYTQSRFDTAFGGKSTTDLTEGTKLFYTQTRFDTAFTAKSTANLTEGTNLYFTDERAQDAAALALTTNATHTGVTVAYNDASNAINITRNTLTYSNVAANGDSTKTAFLASVGRSADNLLVIVNGLISTPTVDYTYADQTVLSGVSGHRGENTIAVSSASGLVIGQPVSGTGIAASATITNIVGTTITLSANNLTYLRRAEISTIGTPVGAVVAGQANQTYTGVDSTTNGSGTGATFDVTRGASGQITGVTVNNGGTNYANGNTITISGLLVGGSSGAQNITFTVSTVNSSTTTATFSPVVKFTSAPAVGTNNVSIRYLPL
jgi:hypothetical protein